MAGVEIISQDAEPAMGQMTMVDYFGLWKYSVDPRMKIQAPNLPTDVLGTANLMRYGTWGALGAITLGIILKKTRK